MFKIKIKIKISHFRNKFKKSKIRLIVFKKKLKIYKNSWNSKKQDFKGF